MCVVELVENVLQKFESEIESTAEALQAFSVSVAMTMGT